MTDPTSKLIEFVRYYANCPCCDQDETCANGCTFVHDDTSGHDVMIQAREALKEANGVR